MADVVKLAPIKTKTVMIRIEGTTPLISHQWSQKALEQMRSKKAGQKKKNREATDPKAEFEGAAYRLTDGRYGIPATGIKNAIASAAHKDMGLARTILRKGLFIHSDETPSGGHPLVAVQCPEPVMREDVVRVGQGSADLRYRPEMWPWAIDLKITFDTEWLTLETIVGLMQRAGFGIGLCEWRPERGGEFGRFEVSTGEVPS